MAETSSNSRPTGAGVILLMLTVAGLALFFWLAPRTPIVATPVATEAAS